MSPLQRKFDEGVRKSQSEKMQWLRTGVALGQADGTPLASCLILICHCWRQEALLFGCFL